MPALEISPIHSLLVSASLGALIGLVRQWSFEKEHRGKDAPAGLRTFTAWSLFGCAAGLLERNGASWAVAVALAAFTVVLGGIHLRGRKDGPLGLTTFSIGLVTFMAGSLAAYQQFQAATALGVGAMVILGSKHWSHQWTRRLKPEDLRVFLQFAAITGIVLPLAPDHDYGPYQAFNPYKIWLMVVLVAGIGLTGYIGIRWLGERAGILITGLAGGLTSSTATTLALSRESRTTPALGARLALAVVLACTVMLVRAVVMLAVIDVEVAWRVLIPFAFMAIPGIAWALWQWFGPVPKHAHGAGDNRQMDTPELANPLGLTMAIKFGLMYAFVVFLVKIATDHFSSAGVYSISFLSGLIDISPITISSAQEVAAGKLSAVVAAQCVLIGALANTLVKAGIALALGAPGYRKAIALALGAVFVAGVAGWFFVR